MGRSHKTATRRRALLLLLGACLMARSASALDCPTGGLCVGALCVGGSSTPCPDDGIACTEERCDAVRGCVHEPVAARCEDGDPCTTGICDPGSGCTQVPATGPSCEDGDACTTIDRCVDGRCVGQPVRCPADPWACTEEQCIAGACRALPRDERCPGAECTVTVCRPGERDADRRGCVAIPARWHGLHRRRRVLHGGRVRVGELPARPDRRTLRARRRVHARGVRAGTRRPQRGGLRARLVERAGVRGGR